ncbi:hypothetical protein ACLOJK_032265 [Asimina triloba]
MSDMKHVFLLGTCVALFRRSRHARVELRRKKNGFHGHLEGFLRSSERGQGVQIQSVPSKIFILNRRWKIGQRHIMFSTADGSPDRVPGSPKTDAETAIKYTVVVIKGRLRTTDGSNISDLKILRCDRGHHFKSNVGSLRRLLFPTDSTNQIGERHPHNGAEWTHLNPTIY